MKSKKQIRKFLREYFNQHGYMKTLEAYEKDIRHGTKLSFSIISPPKRKVSSKLETYSQSKNKNKKLQEDKVPNKFKRVAAKFGIPKEQHSFFYKNRECFNWETFDPDIHCSERWCKFKTKHSKHALDEHMKSAHGWKDFPCDAENCKYVAYSKRSLTFHQTRFHGVGKKSPATYGNVRCPYNNCSFVSTDDSKLDRHLNIHENRMLFCYLCPFRCAVVWNLEAHAAMHLGIQSYKCSFCEKVFILKKARNAHEKRYHSELVCTYCKKEFEKLKKYDEHVRTCDERLKHFN